MVFTKTFIKLRLTDVAQVGGKNASLGEMCANLVPEGIRIPNGFATTANAYWYFLEKAGLKNKIMLALEGLDVHNVGNLKRRAKKVRSIILATELPQELKEAIKKAYRELSDFYNQKNLDVAVRSSATAEDLPHASFAGQQESFLNIQGEEKLLEAVKKCIASLFTDRAIFYREEMKFDHLKIALSVGVQKMVRSDLACSGVMFSCDTESGFPDVVLINASYGLGDNIVQGKVTPDQFYVFETTLKKGFKPIIGKTLGSKKFKLIYHQGEKPIKNIPTVLKDQRKFCLTDKEVLTLAKWSCLIEDYYQRPMDIEWAKDGKDGRLYIVQARPETVQSRRKVNVLEKYVLEKKQKLKVLATGLSVGSKIAQGKVKIIMDAKDIDKFKKGEILVTEMTDPDWVPVMKMAEAIVTNSGGRTAHAAIVSRELGVACIVGTGKATQVLKSGQEVTVSCAEGEQGKVYQGLIPFEIKN